MSQYDIAIEPDVFKKLDRLDRTVRIRIEKVIDRLRSQPRPAQATRLVGSRDVWRVRAGDWRILYTIDDGVLLVLVIDVDHRSVVYDPRR
ncbi:MAG TPA: type II toxin-antitoxin system RelE/ParE family toxin [Micromonosporaceae bacterium]